MIGLALAISLVWFVFEIRDFYNNGGFAHAIAFNLLKLILLAISLAMMILIQAMYTVFPLIGNNQEVEIKKTRRDPGQPRTLPLAPVQRPLANLNRQNSF
jgi:hypothetical protein